MARAEEEVEPEAVEERISEMVEDLIGTEEEYDRKWSDSPEAASYGALRNLTEVLTRVRINLNVLSQGLSELEDIVYSEHADRAEIKNLRRALNKLLRPREVEEG